jgi:hypothetical protein
MRSTLVQDFVTLKDRIRQNPNSAWWIITAAGLLLILAGALGGLMKNYFEGEEFLIFHYAHKLPHQQAWLAFFSKFGRPIEAIYWTYEYELIGFNPLLAHSISFVQLLVIAMLASACFLNIWPKNKSAKLLPYLFTLSLFTNWITVSNIFSLSYDNGRISLIFFFLSGLALQRWASRQLGRWLLLSFAFFFVSLLTYENAAFLFPALVLLALPLLPSPTRDSLRIRFFLFAGLSTASGFVLLIIRLFYAYIVRLASAPVMDFTFSDLTARILEAAPPIYLKWGQTYFVDAAPKNSMIAAGLLLTVALSSVAIIGIYRDGKATQGSDERSRWLHIYLASIWFLVFGPLPYILLGYYPGGRVYSSAVFGVFLLIFMLYEIVRVRLLRQVTVILRLFFVAAGLLMMVDGSTYYSQREGPKNIFYRDLKELIPNVRPHTEFIFINWLTGYQNCGPSLEMLYDQYDLDCLLIWSNNDLNSIRREMEFETDGKDVADGNLILISVIDNVPTVLEELKPGEFDLPITWESTQPLRTNTSRIVTEIQPPSAFYLHLLERAKVLFPE